MSFLSHFHSTKKEFVQLIKKYLSFSRKVIKLVLPIYLFHIATNFRAFLPQDMFMLSILSYFNPDKLAPG